MDNEAEMGAHSALIQDRTQERFRPDGSEQSEPVGAHEQDADGVPIRLHIEIVDEELVDRTTGEPGSYVFLHGLGGTHRYWTAGNGARFLPTGSAVVDLFGFGRSPRPLTRYTLEKHLSALEATLAERDPFVLVGHSLGATLAVAYAARHPEQVERLVLLSLPAYESQRSAVRWLRQRLRGWFFTNMVLTVIVCIGVRRILGPVLPFVIRDVPREVARDLVEHNFMSSTTSLWNVLYRHDIRAQAYALPESLPVTFIHGTDDTTAPIDQIQHLVRQRDSWQLVELNGVDHHPWLREPEKCAAVITAGDDRAGRAHTMPRRNLRRSGKAKSYAGDKGEWPMYEHQAHRRDRHGRRNAALGR